MFSKFELVWHVGGNSDLFVVLTDLLEIPYFQDHGGSPGCMMPCDPTDPREWGMTFPAQIAYNLTKHKYEIISPQDMERVPLNSKFGYIPYDQATGRFRELLALLCVAEKMNGLEVKSMVKELAGAMLKYAEGSDDKS